MSVPFIKMHGLGNDFVIFDFRKGGQAFDKQKNILICDRRRGAGCDQLIYMLPGQSGADVTLTMFNPDGSALEACGNGTRCVASLLMKESGRENCVIGTVAGLLSCRTMGGMIQIDMGKPRLHWKEIPLSEERDTKHLGIVHGRADMMDPVAVNIGNPHAVFFVDDVGKVDVARWGPEVENHVLFPERTNVEFAQVLGPEKIRMRVWERGTGITQACGSGACATIVAAARRGLTGRRAEIVLDGGSLHLEWRESDDHILMTGPITRVYQGILEI